MSCKAIKELVDNAISRQDDDCIIEVERKSLRDVFGVFSAFGDCDRGWC